VLHGCAIERLADRTEHRLPRLAVVAKDAHLDQVVREEGDVDFVQHRRGYAVMTDDDDRFEMMSFGAKLAALGWGKWVHAQECTVGKCAINAK